MNKWLDALICQLTHWFSTPLAIWTFLIICGVLKYLGYGDGPMTFWLSVFAITTSQMILNDGNRDTKAMQHKLDELIRSSEANNELIGEEKKL